MAQRLVVPPFPPEIVMVRIYIYTHICVYTYVVCVYANVYSMYMYVYTHMSMYPTIPYGGAVNTRHGTIHIYIYPVYIYIQYIYRYIYICIYIYTYIYIYTLYCRYTCICIFLYSSMSSMPMFYVYQTSLDGISYQQWLISEISHLSQERWVLMVKLRSPMLRNPPYGPWVKTKHCTVTPCSYWVSESELWEE